MNISCIIIKHTSETYITKNRKMEPNMQTNFKQVFALKQLLHVHVVQEVIEFGNHMTNHGTSHILSVMICVQGGHKTTIYVQAFT